MKGGNDAWLVPFQVCSLQAIWLWAYSSLYDNATDWLAELSALKISKGILLPESASTEEISRYLAAGCRIGRGPESGHTMAYDNPNGLAGVITRLAGH